MNFEDRANLGRSEDWMMKCSMLGLPLAAFVCWQVHHSAKAAAVEHSVGAWIAIGIASLYSAASTVGSFWLIFLPGRVILPQCPRDLLLGLLRVGGISVCLLAYLVRVELPASWQMGTGVMLVLGVALIRANGVRIPIRKPLVTEHKSQKPEAFQMPVVVEPKWDVFLSYRTDDANEVRRLADSLLRSGYRPWFAEYEIPAEEWDDHRAITRRLEEGVAGSRRYLVITNDAWTASDWCKEEMETILQRSEQLQTAGEIASLAEVVAEVRLPPAPLPHKKYPKLAEVKHVAVQHDILEVWSFLQNELGWMEVKTDEPVLAAQAEALAMTRRETIPGGISFPLGGLEPYDNPFDPADMDQGRRWEIFNYEGDWNGSDVKLRVLINPFRNKLGVLTAIPGQSDDRALHRALVGSWAKRLGFQRQVGAGGDWSDAVDTMSVDRSARGLRHARLANLEPLGTHLVHLPDGHSALGLTHINRAGAHPVVIRDFDVPLHATLRCPKCRSAMMYFKDPSVARLGDVVVACQNINCAHAERRPASEQAQAGEVGLSFYTRAESDDPQACRIQIARFAPLIEEIVKGIRRPWWYRMVEWQAVFCRVLIFVIALEAVRYCDIALSARGWRAFWLLACGFSGVDLLMAIGVRGERLEIMGRFYGLKTWLPLGTWFPRWWNIVKGALARSAFGLVMGIFPVGVCAIVAAFKLPDEEMSLLVLLGAAVAWLGHAAFCGELAKPIIGREVHP